MLRGELGTRLALKHLMDSGNVQFSPPDVKKNVCLTTHPFGLRVLRAIERAFFQLMFEACCARGMR